MVEKLRIVTIDGPSGVGKSTVSRGLANRLGFVYLDTGAMYRAVAYGCRERGTGFEDDQALRLFLQEIEITLLPPDHPEDDVRVFLGDKEIGGFLRTPEMGMLASQVSALPAVRKKLTAMQQAMGREGNIVAEGRDTGTVVFPQAAWKFYLDADPEERARRRIDQLKLRGEPVNEEEILAQIIKRDRDDSERTIAPLRAAEDAVRIDTSRLSVPEVIERMFLHIREH